MIVDDQWELVSLESCCCFLILAAIAKCDSGRVVPSIIVLLMSECLCLFLLWLLTDRILLCVDINSVTHRQMEYLFTESGKMQGKL